MPAFVVLYILDPLERAGRSFFQQFSTLIIPYLTISGATVTIGSIAGIPWAAISLSATGAAVVSIFLSFLSAKVPKLPTGWDLLLRVIRTFIGSLSGTLGASLVADGIVDAPWQHALAVAIPVALTALITGLGAIALPGTNGASLLPAGLAKAMPANKMNVEQPIGDDSDDMFPVYDPDAPIQPVTENELRGASVDQDAGPDLFDQDAGGYVGKH